MFVLCEELALFNWRNSYALQLILLQLNTYPSTEEKFGENIQLLSMTNRIAFVLCMQNWKYLQWLCIYMCL